MSSVTVFPANAPPLATSEFLARIRSGLALGERPLAFYGRGGDGDSVVLTAVLEDGGTLSALRTTVDRTKGYSSLTKTHPPFHVFEREVHEQQAVAVHDHPWLKPIRFSGANLGRTAEYPFYKVEGKEVHEVGVGPIHAGVIEPGHFRFMCLGETVHHLEIQLGYQHRNVEGLLLAGDPARQAPLVETIAGDTSIAHTWAYCDALEALAGTQVAPAALTSRAVGLELERVAMHLAGLAGLMTDLAFLQSAATYGRLRTTAINTSMLLCGSRFGRGWIRPGGARAAMDRATGEQVRANLALIRRDIAIVNEHVLASRTVRHRLEGTGIVTGEVARDLGLVGLSARACGVPVDTRASLKGPVFGRLPIEPVVESAGDIQARTLVRIREIDESLRWLLAALDESPTFTADTARIGPLAPDSLAVSVCEGTRGEVVHCVETDAAGHLRHYKVGDPSLRNWSGLAFAVREGGISDFPICNKSFDLSYCGNDL